MDDSLSSTNYMTSQLQSFSSNSSEESGWTLYFEDFLANNNKNNNMDNIDYSSFSSSYSCYKTSSMVSDAHVTKKGGNNNKKLISKNRKSTAKSFVDEELEDTASSPSHSPKINDLDHMYMKSKQLDTQNVSQEKGQNSQHARENNDLGFLDVQLRRKGLCLVPMSMLLDHL